MSEGLFDEAEKFCKKIILENKNKHRNIQLRMKLGNIFVKNGKKTDALELYSKSLSMVGESSWFEKEILAQVKGLHMLERDVKGYQAYLEKLIGLYHKRVILHKNYAQSLVEHGDIEKGLNVYKEILKLTPGIRSYREEYISLLKEAGRTKDALELITEMVERYPKDSELYIEKALLQDKNKLKDEAYKSLMQYLDVSEKIEYNYLRLSRLLMQMNLGEKATEVLEEMILKFSESVTAKESLASHYFKQKEKDKGKALYQKVAATANRDTFLRVVDALSFHGEKVSAFEMFEPRLGKVEQDFFLTKKYSELASELKKEKEALIWVNKLLLCAVQDSEFKMALQLIVSIHKKFKKLEKLQRELEENDQANINERCLLLEIYFRQLDLEKVNDYLKRSIALFPESNRLVVQEIRYAKKTEQWERAIELTESLLKKKNMQRSTFYRDLSELNIKVEKYDKALHWISAWKKSSPGSSSPYFEEAKIYQLQDKTDKAIDVMRSASLKFDGEREILLQLASLYDMGGKLEDAILTYWRVIESIDDIFEKLTYINPVVRLHQRRTTIDKLIRHFKTRIQSNPNSIFPLLAMSEVYRLEGGDEKRKAYLLKVSNLRKDDVALLHQIAIIEESTGNDAKALQTLKDACKLDKTHRSKRKLAQHYYKYGEFEQGNRLMIELVSEKKMGAKDIEKLGITFITSKQYGEGIQFLGSKLLQYPKNYRLRYLYAMALEEGGRILESIEAFKKLLDVHDEMKGVKKKQGRNLNQFGKFLKEKFPKEVARMQFIAYSKHQLYLHRRAQNAYSYGMLFQSNALTLPKNVDELHAYSLGHIKEMGKDLNAEEFNLLIEDIRNRGIAYPEIKLRDYDSLTPYWDGIKEKYFEDEVVLLYQGMVNMYQAGDRQSYLDLYKKFKETRPYFAASLMISGLRFHEFDLEIIDDAIEVLSNSDEVAHAQMLINPINDHRSYISPEVFKKLRSAFMNKYPKIKKDIRKSPWFLAQVIALMSRENIEESFFSFLDAEINENQGIKNNNTSHYRYRHRQNKLIALPSFPPRDITSIPDSISLLFSNEKNHTFSHYYRNINLDIDELKKYFSKIKSPALKIIVASYCDLKNELKGAVQEYLAVGQKTLEHYRVESAFLVSKENYQQAFKVLKKARSLPMSLSQRKKIDGQMLACAMELKKNKDILNIAKKVAMRMRFLSLSAQDRQDLSNVFKEFGMEKEAEKIDKRIPQISSRSRSYAYRNQRQRVQNLISKNKENEALKILIKDYKLFVRGVLNTSGQTHSNSRQLNYLWQDLKRNNLEKLFQNRLEKDNKKNNVLKHLELAYFYENTHAFDKAVSEYQKILSIKPKHRESIIRLSSLYVLSDQKKARELLWSIFRVNQSEALLRKLEQEVYNLHDKADRKLSFAYLMLFILEETKDRNLNNTYLFPNIYYSIAGNMYDRKQSRSIPSIYSGKEKYQNEIKAFAGGFQKVISARNEWIKRSCDMLISKPKFADFGFTMKYQAKLVCPTTDDELYRLAVDVIHKKIKNRGVHILHTRGAQFNIVDHSPESFIVNHLFAKGQRDKLDSLIEELDPSRGRKVINKLQCINGMYDSDRDSFIQLANQFIKDSKSFGGTQDPILANNIVNIWKLSQRKFDINDWLSKYVGKGFRVNQYYQSGFVKEYIPVLYKRLGRDVTVDFMKKIKKAVFVSERHIARLNIPINGYHQDTQIARGFVSIVEGMMAEEELTFDVLNCVQDIPNVFVNRNYFGSLQRAYQKIRPSASLLIKSPFLGAWNQPNPNTPVDLLTKIVSGILSNKNEMESAVTSIQKLKEKTFGAILIEKLLNQESAEKVYHFLGENIDEFRKGSKDEQRYFVNSVRYYILRQYKGFNESAFTGNAKLFSDYAKTVSEKNLKQMIKAQKRSRSRNSNAYSDMRLKASLIRKSVVLLPEEASKTFDETVKVLSESSYFKNRRGYQNSVVVDLANEIQRKSELSVRHFCNVKLQKHEFNLSYYPYHLKAAAEQRLIDICDRELKRLKARPLQEGETHANDAYQAALIAVNETVKDMGNDVAIGLDVRRFLSKVNRNDWQRLLESIKEIKNGTDFLQELIFHIGIHVSRKNKSTPPTEEFKALFLSGIEKQSISKSYKVEKYGELFVRYHNLSDIQELSVPLLKLLLEYNEKGFRSLNELKYYTSALSYFIGLKRDDEWRGLADQIYAFWKSFAYRSENAKRENLKEYLKLFDYLVLEVAFLKGDREMVLSILKHKSSYAPKLPQTYSLLLHGEYKDWVVENFPKVVKEIEIYHMAKRLRCHSCGNYHSQISGYYHLINQEKLEVVTALIDRFESNDLQMFLKIMYESFKEKFSDKLIQEFLSYKFSDMALRNKSLDFLLIKHRGRMLEDEWIQTCHKENIEEVSGSQQKWRRERYIHYMAILLRKGMYDEFWKVISEYKDVGWRRNYQLWRMHGRILKEYSQYISSVYWQSEHSVEQNRSLINMGEQMIKIDNRRTKRDRERLFYEWTLFQFMIFQNELNEDKIFPVLDTGIRRHTGRNFFNQLRRMVQKISKQMVKVQREDQFINGISAMLSSEAMEEKFELEDKLKYIKQWRYFKKEEAYLKLKGKLEEGNEVENE